MNGQVIANLTLQLQKSLDSNYDVTDMGTVLYVIQQLEGTTITKEQLETTRLAFYINQLRRRTISQTLARRAKNLLKKWRDMVMPQQPSSSSGGVGGSQSQTTSKTAPPPPPLSTASGGGSLTLVARSPNILHQQSHSLPPTMFNTSSSPTLHQSLRHPTNVTNLTSKIQSGSANNHSKSNRTSYGLMNGDHPTLGSGSQHQRFAAVNVAAAAIAAAAAVSRSNAATVASPSTISPPTSEVIDLSAFITKTDGKPNYAKKQQSHPLQQQPTSFANLITSQSQPPISYSNVTHDGAGPSSSNSSNFNDLMRRSESPTVTLPRITRMMNEQYKQYELQNRRQLDFVSLPSSRSRVVSPVIQPNNKTPSKRKTVASMLSNGDAIPTGYVSSVLPSSAYDFHDSNSTNTMDNNSMATSSAQHQAQHSQNQSNKCYSTVPPGNAAETYSSLSNHRKSKKHKKDKKRNKQSPDDVKSPSQVAAAASASSIMQRFVEEIPAAGEETMMTSVPGAVATVIFPPHDSLSSSSMSLFPSTSTNTMMIQNTSRMLSNNYGGLDNPTESDLTFAGKFKSSSSTTAISGSISGVPSIASSTNNSSFDTVLSPASATTKKSSEKEADLIVVVESRSCSPFITEMAHDSSTSCSRATTPDIVNVIHQDSNQGGGGGVGGAEPKMSTAAATVQTIKQQSPIAKPAVPPIETVVPGQKKRGRKKGSRGIDAMIAQTHAFLNTSMFERPRLLFAGSKKVKTTKELLADIQSRKLGSSATSSPTLPLNRQSASPSTCSEASLQSDITNIRVSSLNLRSSPEFNRQSDPEDANSATDSNEAVGPSSSSKNVADLKSTTTTTGTVATLRGGYTKSIEEHLNELKKQLPVIDYTKLHLALDEVPCTCTIRLVEPAATALPPNEEVVIIKSDDDEFMFKPAAALFPPTIDSKTAADEVVVVTAVLPALESPMLPIKKSPKKQIKSIFDLDYDDDNDPLHTFVEAAKLRSNNEITSTTADEHKSNAVTSATDEYLTNDGGASVHVAVNSSKKLSERSIAVPSSSSLQTIAPPIQLTVATASSLGEQQQLDANMMMMPAIPQYEVVEDENCPAKYRYDIQPNCITEYHINALHNFYLPNVNGNWNASIPASSVHRKKLRHHRCRTKNATNNDGEEKRDCKVQRIRQRRDSSSTNSVGGGSSSSSDELYERVVPQYDYINMDKVLKDLSHVKFKKNYVKKKLKREGSALLAAAATAETTKSENIRNSYRKSSKRKRLQSDSNSRDTIATAVDDCGDDGVKHKHQKRKKHKKLLSTILDNNSCSLSKVKTEDGLVEKVVEFNAGNNNNNNNDNNTNDDDEVGAIIVVNDKPNTFSDDSDNACDYDDESHAALMLSSSSLEQKPIENYGLSITMNQEDIKVAHKHESIIDEITFIESSSNSTNSYTSNKNNAVNKYNSRVSISSIGNNSIDPFDDDEYMADSDDDDDNGNNNNDDDAAAAAVDVDEEYDEDDEENDEEHEVVTHDMTSSTSTTSQQHIVLTIKKKILRSSEDNENATSLTPPPLPPPQPSSVTAALIDSTESMNTSTSPTTIRLRRFQKPPKQITPIKNAVADQDGAAPNPIIIERNNQILHIFDNNNIKANLNDRMAVSQDIAFSSSSPADNLVLVDSTALSSSNLLLPQEHQQLHHHNHDDDNKEPTTDNFNLSRNNININDKENRCYDRENSSYRHNDQAAAARTDGCNAEIRSFFSDVEKFDTIENHRQQLLAINDPDNDSNDTTDDLPLDNNHLLRTFNVLTEDNRIGIRLMNETNNNNNNSAKINRNSSDSCEQRAPTPNITTTTIPATIPATINTTDAGQSSATIPTASSTAASTVQVQEFKEWHEVLQVHSYNDELLTILPYVVID